MNLVRTTLILALATLGFTPEAGALSQAEALAEASRVAREGSDQSLQSSTTSAMRALLELNNQNRPGAVYNGYKSFGEYRTSQDLDIDRMKARIRQIDLFTNQVTVGQKLPAWALNKETFLTTFERLDPRFLRNGEAGQVADEFERKSGMPREVFLRKMSAVSRMKLSSKDSQLTDKILQQLGAFVDEIPNEEFRSNIKTQLDAVGPNQKMKLITDGATRLFDVLASYGVKLAPKVVIPAFSDTERAPAASSVATAPTPAATQAFTGVPARGTRGDDPLAASKGNFERDMAAHDADFKGLGREKFAGDALGSVMQTALDEQDSIFRQVSRRYRSVAPSLMRMQ